MVRMTENTIKVDRESLIEVSKPLFYGFTLLAAVSLTVSPQFSGTLLGVATLAAITFVSAGLADLMEDDWERFIDIIAVITLLGAVVTASYTAILLSFI